MILYKLDCKQKHIEKLAYTSRQLNTLPSSPLAVFNCAFFCAVDQLERVCASAVDEFEAKVDELQDWQKYAEQRVQ